MVINHATRFFKEIKRLEDALAAVEKDRPFGRTMVGEDGVKIMTWWTHEAHEEDCFVRPDGLWESKPESYGRDMRKFIFIWREHPNYCCAGQPHYSWDERDAFREKSESQKILYTFGEYQFAWAWEDVIMPNRICWGMKSGPKFYRLLKNDEILFESDIKKHFNRRVKEIMG